MKKTNGYNTLDRSHEKKAIKTGAKVFIIFFLLYILSLIIYFSFSEKVCVNDVIEKQNEVNPMPECIIKPTCIYEKK